MDRLTPPQRIVVAARCGEAGLSVDECAERMHVGRSTIKRHSGEAMRRLELRSFHQVCTLFGVETGRKPTAGMRAQEV